MNKPGSDRRWKDKLIKNDRLLEDVHCYRFNRHTFTIYVGGDPSHGDGHDASSGLNEPGVEYMMADRFEINLNTLSEIDPKAPILINLSSCGGDWEEGMKMFGAILMCPNPITVLATKWARSMTSIIPLAADRFFIRPPSKYMFHRGQYGFTGLDQEAETADIERRKAHEMMFRIYVARLMSQGCMSTWSDESIRKLLDEKSKSDIDVWFTADEAVHWGFADGVFEGDFKKLRITRRNIKRRAQMLEVLRRPLHVTVSIS